MDEDSASWMIIQISVEMMNYTDDNIRMEKTMFGKTLEQLIKQQSMSIRQFAKAIDVSPKTAQEWVGKEGRFPSNPDVLKKIANLFDVTIHELIYGEADPREFLGSILEKTEIHTGMYEITVKKVKVKK